MDPRTSVQLVRMFIGLAGRVPATHLTYLARMIWGEKPHRHDGQLRINSFFPPYPSVAYDRFRRSLIDRRRVPYSAYVAVTDACPYACPHCSYDRRTPANPSRDALLDLVRQAKALGVSTLGLTGGEPLLRDDLEDLLALAHPEMATILFTTGHGLDSIRARRLAAAGAGNITLGIESADAAEHDRVRGLSGSFDEAQAAAAACREAGLYTSLSTVGTAEKLVRGDLDRIYELAAAWGARELRILPPVVTGGWVGCTSVMLTPTQREALARFHIEHNRRRAGPAVAALPYLESAILFGCGAGYHHVFVDAGGEVCPCDLAPMSFGSIVREPLAAIWDRMAEFFPTPRRTCLMGELAGKIDGGALPLPREVSERLCREACASRVSGADGGGEALPEVYRRLFRCRR